MIKQQKAAARSAKRGQHVQTLARTDGLDKAAADKNLTVTTTDLIAQTDPLPGVGNAPDFMSALFSREEE